MSNGLPVNQIINERINMVCRKWSKAEIKALRKTWPNGSPGDIIAALSRADPDSGPRGWDAIKKQAQRLGLRKTKKYMRSLGRKK